MDELDKVELVGEKIERVKRSTGEFINGSLHIFEVIAIFIVAVACSFAELSIGGGSGSISKNVAGISARVIIIFCCSYMAYITMSQKGVISGKSTKGYKNTLNEYTTLCESLSNTANNLNEFCKWYIEQELEYYRKQILYVIGISYEYWKANYQFMSKSELLKATITVKTGETETTRQLSKLEVNYLLRANNAKPMKLTPTMLLTKDAEHRTTRAFTITGDKALKVSRIGKFITSMLWSICAGLIAVDFLLNISWKAFILMVVRIFPMVVNVFTGYMSGFKAYAETDVKSMRSKNSILKSAKNYFSVDNTVKE